MIEVHRMFRAGFGEGPDLVAAVRDGDAAHADAVGDHLAMLSAVLHSHHELEDDQLWDKVGSRAPTCLLHVDRMRQQHAEMLVHLTALDAALPAWRSSGSELDAEPVLDALHEMNAALAEHLPDEETNIVPVMEQVLVQGEIDAAEHGRKHTPKGKTFTLLGMIMAPSRAAGTSGSGRTSPRRSGCCGAWSAGGSTRRAVPPSRGGPRPDRTLYRPVRRE